MIIKLPLKMCVKEAGRLLATNDPQESRKLSWRAKRPTKHEEGYVLSPGGFRKKKPSIQWEGNQKRGKKKKRMDKMDSSGKRCQEKESNIAHTY